MIAFNPSVIAIYMASIAAGGSIFHSPEATPHGYHRFRRSSLLGARRRGRRRSARNRRKAARG